MDSVAQGAEEWALYYLSLGWSVIPLRPQDKRPALRWRAYQERFADIAELQEWFRRWPNANIGIVTGTLSGLIVLDVDSRHGGDRSLKRLVDVHGSLPRTIQVVTGGGGRHHYFSHGGVEIHNRAGIAPGIDVRAQGGYVVAPPSIHPNGRPYVWVEGNDPRSVSPAPFPRWLSHEADVRAGRHRHSKAYWRELIKMGVPEGERNTTIASITGHLLWHGVDPEVAMELMLSWNRVRCRPPLSDEEVVRTVESITRLHRRETEHSPG